MLCVLRQDALPSNERRKVLRLYLVQRLYTILKTALNSFLLS